MIWLLLLSTLVHKTLQVGIVGNPLAHARPCGDNNDILASYEPGLPPGEENQYNLNIIGKIQTHSQINLRFDSDATVVLSDPMKARITTFPSSPVFNVRFFKGSPKLNVQVKGPATGTIPYIQSIVLDDDEICVKPNTGYFDRYIQGIRDTAKISLTVPDESCGRRKVTHTELIVRGQSTKPGDWPWHVAIFRVQGSIVKYICGGTLLSKTLVLTAAHCATIRGDPVIPNSLSIVLGKYNLIGGDIAPQEREASIKMFILSNQPIMFPLLAHTPPLYQRNWARNPSKVFEIIVHSEFDAKTLNNDIALLKLKSEAVFDDYVQPACLWNTNNYKKLPSGDVYGTVVGWGFDHQDVLSTTLQQITIPLINEATCLKSNTFFYKKLNTNKFCAGFTNGTSACNGDSGGGFIIFVPDTPGGIGNVTGAYHVRGIVSTTVSRRDAPICDPYQYTLFTDVGKYRDWINGYLK